MINVVSAVIKYENGKIKLLEHEDYNWVSKLELNSFQFATADMFIVEGLI